MNSKPYRRFYFLSIAVLLTLSSYPLFNGVRMAVLSLQNDVIEPEQYAKYVVPYAAICTVIILFALFQPASLQAKTVRVSSRAYGGLRSVLRCRIFYGENQSQHRRYDAD